jgi:hypothetical protein
MWTAATQAQVFLYPPRLFRPGPPAGGEEFPSGNGASTSFATPGWTPQWASVERGTLTIAGRAISSLIQTQGLGDLYRIYTTAQQDGLDYNLAYIGADFQRRTQGRFRYRVYEARCLSTATSWRARVIPGTRRRQALTAAKSPDSTPPAKKLK